MHDAAPLHLAELGNYDAFADECLQKDRADNVTLRTHPIGVNQTTCGD
jgi:hypothetical protein